MRWTYDLETGCAYVYFGDGEIVRQTELAEGRAVADLSATGEPVGLELLVVPQPLSAADLATLHLDPFAESMVQAVAAANLPRLRAGFAATPGTPDKFFSDEREVELSLA